MAIFQKTCPKERDVTEKHAITRDEIRFLKDLQHELNVQDSMGNKDPRFWVIKESRKVYGNKDGYYDYVTVTDKQDPETEIWNLDMLFDAMSKLACNRTVPYEVSRNHDGYVVVVNTDDDSSELIRRIDENTVDVLNGIAGDNRFELNYVASDSRVVHDTLFLTHRSCEEHLRKYGYNYAADAHAYAMTADRSPEYEALVKLLRTVDFDAMERAMA